MPLRNDIQMIDSKKKPLFNSYASDINWIYIIYVFSAAYILKHTFVYWVFISAGVVGCLSVIIYLSLFIRTPKVIPKRKNFRRFKALFTDSWEENVHQLHHAEIGYSPIIRESFLISETLEEFINLIVQEFIDGWFQKISECTIFQDCIKNELRFVTRGLKERLEKVDFASLLVSKMTPVITEHFNLFIKAYDSVKIKNSKLPVDSIDFQVAVTQQYDRGKIHSGVTITKDINSVTNLNEKRYLREKISSVLPYLLSNKEKNNDVSGALIKEILSCTILYNIFQMVSESDFYNLMIQKCIGDNLKHKYQVNQLRAALKEYSQRFDTVDIQPNTLNTATKKRNAVKKKPLNIKENMNNDELEEALQSIASEVSQDELKKIKRKIIILLKNSRSKVNGTFNEKRLRICMSKVNDQLARLDITPSSSSISENDKRYTDFLRSLGLIRILNDKSAFIIFYEFMNDKGKKLLKLWQMIDSIKAPLEDSTINVDGESKLSLSSEFSSADDITAIYNSFFNDVDIEITAEDFKAVQDFINSKTYNRIDYYREARKHLFKLQNQVFDQIELYFPEFKNSSFFSKVLELSSIKSDMKTYSSTPNSSADGESQADNSIERLNIKYNKESDSDNFVLKKKLSRNVVKAVEDAFTEIMNNSEENRKIDSINNKEIDPILYEGGNSVSTVNIKRDLFGDSSSLFDDTIVSPSSRNRNSKLFDDISEESDNDSDSLDFDSDNQLSNSLELEQNNNSDSQLFLAAPGNLSLSEEISKLTDEIEKLDEQKIILEPLIRKAELTNNIPELKILRKSRTSLEREINSKELQKQQYIVQENDNSLYGKSTVRIQSYISGNENSKDFILYIVEVQKFSSENPNIITAGWIVARRYSQFFKLHEYLKAKYPVVSMLKFPKRMMSVLKFHQRQLVELRKASLEEYLRKLLEIPDVCSNRVFRSFLSSENFNIRKNQLFDDSHDGIHQRNGLEMASTLYNGLSNRLITNQSIQSHNSAAMENLKDIERELRQFDESTTNDVKQVFVKPICDLLMAVFKLNSSNSWIRARALLVILQQIFGSTIERKVYEQVQYNLQTEERILDTFMLLKNMIFPNGKFKDPPIIRNSVERSTTKNDANILLGVFMNETFSKIFGSSNTRYAHVRVFEMLQNDFLNKHLLFEVFDIIIDELFPESITD